MSKLLETVGGWIKAERNIVFCYRERGPRPTELNLSPCSDMFFLLIILFPVKMETKVMKVFNALCKLDVFWILRLKKLSFFLFWGLLSYTDT